MNSNKCHLLSRILIIVGGIATVVGAVDPLEGSVLILPGSGLFALGTFLGQSERRVVAFRVLVFVLIAIGVGALWGLSAAGGFGGSTGRSMWWGVLILPYLIGLPLGIWGPGAPRWILWPGIAVGLWYLTIFARTSARSGIHLGDAITILAALGVLIIGGCLWRLGGLGGRTAKP